MEPHLGAQVAQAVSRRLATAMEKQGWSANALAKASGVNRQAIAHVLAGKVWPDLLTVVNLEGALGVGLWPSHWTWPQDDQGRPVDPEVRAEVADTEPAE